jgi:long-chain fatty acid transport protein
MGRRLFFLISIHIMVVQASWSGGFEGPGLGARATGMGGAFIGVADDWTAIYWNPAGLAQLRGTGVGTSTEYLQIHAHDSNGLVNPLPPIGSANILRQDAFLQLGGEPLAFHGQDSRSVTFLPSVGFYTRWNGFVLAGGSYVPLGSSFEVADHSVPGYDVSFKSRAYIITHNFSVATQASRWIQLGAGVNAVQAHAERFANKTAPVEEFSSSSSAGALGVQGVFGVLVKLHDTFHVGGVYRTGHDLNMRGESSVQDSLFPLPVPGLGVLQNESSRYNQKLRDPTTYGLGLAFWILPELTLTADWQRTQWSAMRVDIQFDQPGIILQNQQMDPGWSSTNRYRFGVEWRPSHAWSVRAGYFRDPRAVSFQSEALTQIIDADQRYYTAGLGYQKGHWRVNLDSQYSYGQEQLSSRTLKREANSQGLEIEYLF